MADHNKIPLLPIKNIVILPKSIIPVIVGRPASVKAVEEALKDQKGIFVTAQKSPDTEHPEIDDVFRYGTKASILQVMRMPNNALKILIEGEFRAEIIDVERKDDFLMVEYKELVTKNKKITIELEAAWRELKKLYSEYIKLNERAPIDIIDDVLTISEIDSAVDTIAIHLDLSFDERQDILETNDLKRRIYKIIELTQKEISILHAQQRIKGHVQSQVEKNQKEYYLTEQIKAIQKELGREDQQAEVEQMRANAKKLNLPKDAAEKVEKEFKRLEQMPPMSAESSVSRNYIDWILSLPWHKESKDSISLEKAEKILNDSHSGMKKPKERILEFLAAKKFSGNSEKSPIICFVGPPGVGKTSLAQAIAKSLGRELVRIALGGVRDDAEIRGHRRTYIGALPGKIIQAIKKAGTINPVIVLDEIDKLSRDSQSDPSSSLLEVLDPEQNKQFVDHYLDIDYDLSKIMFILTANSTENIPLPLYDRIEIIYVSGYTDQEKLTIAKKFLIPKKLKEYNLKKNQFILEDQEILELINGYTKEAGVRQLERVIAKLMRKTIQEILKNNSIKNGKVTLDLIKNWLGQAKFKPTILNDQEMIGVCTGLAWTEVGGDVLEIEVTILQGKGNLTLTGQLGEVMQESAQAALSYVRSRYIQLGLDENFYADIDIHIHIPEGATPKDGPSAGITMCVALISALTKTAVCSDIAMTGEVTLRGRVLGVGGLKEKLLAAKRYHKKRVILPKENYDDVQEFVKELDGGVELFFVSTMDEVLKHAFVKIPVYNKENKLAKNDSKKVKSKASK
jgi:ATP-dependent Lon protease